MATVHYLVTDVERSIDFDTEKLGFKLEQGMAPAFARVTHKDPAPPGGRPILLEGPDGNGVERFEPAGR